jgi:acyl-CoA thioester hydrolase
VLWSECDPAGVVFAGNFSFYVHHAADRFRAFLFGKPWHLVQQELGVSTPAKTMSLVFHRALSPSEVFDMEVRVAELRRSTIRFVIRATIEAQPAFDAELTSICIAPPVRRAVEIPERLRRVLQDYQASLPGH